MDEEVDADSFDKSESLDNLEEMFNDAKKKVTPVDANNNNIQQKSNEAFILHSPRPNTATGSPASGHLVGNLINVGGAKNSSELNSSDSLTQSKNQTAVVGQLVGSVLGVKTNGESNMVNGKHGHKYDSFDSDSEEESHNKNSTHVKFNNTG